MDRGAWWDPIVHGIAKNRLWLSMHMHTQVGWSFRPFTALDRNHLNTCHHHDWSVQYSWNEMFYTSSIKWVLSVSIITDKTLSEIVWQKHKIEWKKLITEWCIQTKLVMNTFIYSNSLVTFGGGKHRFKGREVQRGFHGLCIFYFLVKTDTNMAQC